MVSLEQLKSSINQFCSQYLPERIDDYKTGKVIHDTTWGTNYFEPYEISLINTPILQRLRYISQMGCSQALFIRRQDIQDLNIVWVLPVL